MKGLEWLKEEVGELNLVDTVFEADGVSYIDTAVSVMQVYDLIDELDEPEVLSQEWIRNNQERKGVHFFVNVTKLQNLLVPKQEELETKIHELIESYKQEEDAYSNLENGWISGFIEDLKNLVAEEPLYHALIKGHELVDFKDAWACNYWNLSVLDGRVFPSDKSSKDGLFSTKMTKSEWNKLGINDSNADFVKVGD